MLEYSNNKYKTFYFSGTQFIRFSVFNKSNLMDPISFKKLKEMVTI